VHPKPALLEGPYIALSHKSHEQLSTPQLSIFAGFADQQLIQTKLDADLLCLAMP